MQKSRSLVFLAAGISVVLIERRTRAAPWGASIRLFALTGWGQEQDRQEALDAGFDHHLVKPVDTAVLIQRLVE